MSETTIPLQEIHAPITPPEKYTPDAYERTAEGYLGLAVELRETQRALSQDFRVLMAVTVQNSSDWLHRILGR